MRFGINVMVPVSVAALLLSGCDDPGESDESAAEAEEARAEAVDDVRDPLAGRAEETEEEALARARGITREEAEAHLARQVLAPDLENAARATLGGSFGGVWIDDDGEIKVGVAGLDESRTEAVRRAAEQVGLLDHYQAVDVRYTMRQLEQANDFLADRLVEIAADEGPGLVAGLRTDINAVELQTQAGAELTDAQRRLVADAMARFGGLLVIGETVGRAEPRACKYPYCDAPLRGGVGIFNGGGCTAGFVAASKLDGKLYQFTAGHCGAAGAGNWSTRFANGELHVIGAMWNRRVDQGGDMGIVKINNPAGWKPGPWIRTSSDSMYTITGEKGSVIGMSICTSGASYGQSSCGKVTQLGVTIQYKNGPTVKGLGRGSFCGIGGDSGAPMYSSHVAYGLQVSGFSQCDSLYQGILAAQTAMNVNVVHQ